MQIQRVLVPPNTDVGMNKNWRIYFKVTSDDNSLLQEKL